MKVGDLVRFAKWDEVMSSQWKASKHWHMAPKRHIGTLVKHDRLMGTAHILHEGEVLKVRQVLVQKAGKRDLKRNEW